MASSGQVTLSTQSVDYPCCPYGRGAILLTNVIGWSVNNNADISFWLISSSDNAHGTWGICTSGAGYYIKLQPQVSYDNGASWVTLDTKQHWVSEICGSGYTNTVSMSTSLIGQLGSYHLSGNCILRFLYYMTVAPAPSADFPNAFPNESYSEAVQVPVVVEVNWTSTLKYNANGGSGAPADQTHSNASSASSYAQTVSSTVPTRTNYRFEGWADSASASTAQYQPGGTVTIQKSSPTKTIYAVWTEFYRPGERKVSGTWSSTNRSGGACERKVSDTWTEMRTIDGGTGTGDEPTRKSSGTWYNQRKIGAE